MKKFLLFTGLITAIGASSQMYTESVATQMGTCDCYQMTNSTGQNGAIWSPNTIDITNSFDFSFEVYLGNSDGGSDGMVFVLQSNPDGIGNIGYTMGYGNCCGAPNPVSTQSIGIEIDTYNNAPTVPTDIASDHIGLSSALSNNHNLGGPYAIANIEDGAYHTFHVTWTGSPTNILTLVLDGTPIFAYTEDFTNTVFGGDPNVYFGWTAATGFADQQVVCTYRTAAFSEDLTSVCPELPVTFTDGSTSDLNMISSWAWDFGDGSPIDNSQNPVHSWTTPGTYTVTMTMLDPFDCPDVSTVDITVLPDIILNMDSIPTTCYGYMDGQATGIPTNGTGPYVYAWNDPGTQTTQTATGLDPNQYYTVTVTDNLGCTGTDSVMVTEPAEITLNMDSTNVLCNGGSDGTVTATPNNGVSPFNYLWDDGSSQTSSTATGLTPGVYTVTVTDDSGCVAIDSVSITEPTALSLSATSTYDDGTSNGTIDLTVSGGTGPYTYSWDLGMSTEDLTGLAAGTYVVTVTDANGCSDTLSVTVLSEAGINDLGALGFKIYPNPTNGMVNIIGTGNYQISILDMSGRIVYGDYANENTNIDLSQYEKGVYLIQINKDGEYAVERLILQ